MAKKFTLSPKLEEKLKGAKTSLTLNRAYVIGGAIPTAIPLVVVGIISLFK